MAAFTGHSAEPCYTPRPVPNYQLRLLVENLVRDTERSFPKTDLIIKSIAPPVVPHDPSFLRESEETVPHSTKQTKRFDKVCAQLSQDHLSATIKEEEEDEGGYKDIVEQTEVVTENSRDDHDKECLVVANHTFPHPTPSFEETSMSKEMQKDLIEETAWRLALQSLLEEEERERVQKEVLEDDKSEAEGVLNLFLGVIPYFEEGRGIEEAIGVQVGGEVEVEEACTGPMLQVISPPNFEDLF
ncbi:unnamed protein product [Linum trigynum]|uniref:Uncharacterized protein n=1 Tax=Linum trigynum TaxID=586398 RepID=A0AAV2E5G7_9ROSI